MNNKFSITSLVLGLVLAQSVALAKTKKEVRGVAQDQTQQSQIGDASTLSKRVVSQIICNKWVSNDKSYSYRAGLDGSAKGLTSTVWVKNGGREGKDVEIFHVDNKNMISSFDGQNFSAHEKKSNNLLVASIYFPKVQPDPSEGLSQREGQGVIGFKDQDGKSVILEMDCNAFYLTAQ